MIELVIYTIEEKTTQDDDEEDSDRPVFSTITGKYRQAKRFRSTLSTNISLKLNYNLIPTDKVAPTAESETSAVIIRNQDSTVSKLSGSAAGIYVQLALLSHPLIFFNLLSSILARAFLSRAGNKSWARSAQPLRTR